MHECELNFFHWANSLNFPISCQNISAETDNDEPEEDSSEDERRKKKKREAPKGSKGVSKADKKKESDSFKWSNIFGLDRKKKSTGLIFHPLEVDNRRRKRCKEGECTDEPDYGEWLLN